MKKLSYLLAPLMALPFVISCGNGGGGNTPDPDPPTVEWYADDEYLNSLTEEDVGTIKTVKVNGIDHKVRLIGIDQDKESTDSTDNPTPTTKYAHTTWEFVNFICDKDGYSLATFWNDIETPADNHPCKDYLNSSIRYALMGDEVTYDIMPVHGWYEKGKGTRSDTYKDPVIKMLPADLVKNIKPVEKNFIYYSNSGYQEMTCDDKLFILSSDEMTGTRSGDKNPYMYYHNAGEIRQEADIRRIKKQVKGVDGASTAAANVKDSQQLDTQIFVESIAGYNSTAALTDFPRATAGAGYWLRDIETDNGDSGVGTPFGASSDGGICNCGNSGHGGRGNLLATPIAPAFCL